MLSLEQANKPNRYEARTNLLTASNSINSGSQDMVITNFAVALAIISAGLAAAFYTLFVRFGRGWNNR